MKKKMLKRSLALGALMAFVITGSAMAASSGILADKDTGDINGNDKFPDGVISDVDYGIYVKGTSEHSITASMNLENIDINANQKGLFSEYGGSISLNSSGELNINVENKSNAYGVHIQSSTGYPHGNVKLDSKDLAIDVTSGDVAYGITAEQNSSVTVNSDNLDIKVNGKRTGKAIEAKSNINNSDTYTAPTNITINVGNKAKFEAEGDAFAIGVNATMKDASANISANLLEISAITDGKQSNSYASGLRTEYSGMITVNANRVDIDAINSGSGDAIGVYVKGSTNYDKASSINVDANLVEINTSANNGNLSSAVFANAEGIAIVGKENSEVVLKAESSNGKSYAVFAQASKDEKYDGGNIAINGKSIQILSDGDNARGVDASNNSKIDIGNVDSMVTVKVTGKQDAVGIAAFAHGVTTINGDRLVIDVESSDADGEASGVHVQNNGLGGELATVNINSANTVIKAKDAISAYSEGVVNVNGNIYTEGENAVVARGDAQVNINTKGENNIVQMNGDVVFDVTNDGNSGLEADADINIKLTNSESYLKGNIVKNLSGSDEGVDMTVTGMGLELANGGTWNTDATSFVNNLTFDGGVINVNGGDGHKVQLDNVTGAGGEINIKGELKDGNVENLGSVSLGKDANSTVEGNIDFSLGGLTADDITDNKAALEALAGSVTVNGNDGAKLDATVNIKEGLITGGSSGNLNVDNGKVSLDEGSIHTSTSTSTMDGMRDIASTAIVAWRQEDSTLSQRLGELRNSEGDQGIWTRMSRGEFEYEGAYKNQYNYFQLGYDKAYGDWHYGAAISHNDGETAYAGGKGENSSTSLSLYGTWLGNDGEYADVVLKHGRLDNEFDIYTDAGHTHGDYDMWGTSLSGEYGKKIELKDGWYVTPQGQLTFMYIGGEDYTTDNGIDVSQDSMTSLVGRAGFEMGKTVSDKGSVYVKASLLHEFNGDADTVVRLGDKVNSYTQDLGDTWYEAGIGFNYKTSAASYVYADVVKTYGGDVETPWQWNVGVRYSF